MTHDTPESQLSDLEQLFHNVATLIRDTPVTPDLETSDSDKLRMYGLYKHVTTGPCNGNDLPSVFHVVARAKYQAWADCSDQTVEQAQLAYVELAATYDHWLGKKCREMLNQFKQRDTTLTDVSKNGSAVSEPATTRTADTKEHIEPISKESVSRVSVFLEKHVGKFRLIPRGQLDISYLDLIFAGAHCLYPGASSMRYYCKLENEISGWWLKQSRQNLQSKSVVVGFSVRSLLDLYLTSRSYPPRSEVIVVPPINIPGMMDVLKFHNLHIVSVDIPEPSLDLCIDLKAVESVLSEKTTAVMVVHPCGMISATPNDMRRLRELSRDRNFDIIEDCAECYSGFGPTSYVGSTYSDVSLVSFGTIKTATALGGGIAILRNKECSEKMTRIQHSLYQQQTAFEYLWKVAICLFAKFVSEHPILYGLAAVCCENVGIDFDNLVVSATRGFAGKHSTCSPETGRDKDESKHSEDLRLRVFVGQLRHRPSSPLLALLRRRLSQHQWTAKVVRARIKRCKQMSEILGRNAPGIAVPSANGETTHLFWLYSIKFDTADSVCKFMRKNGFDVPRGTSQLTCVSSMGAGDCPNTENVFNGILYLPVASRTFSLAEMENVAHLLRSATQDLLSDNLDGGVRSSCCSTKRATRGRRLCHYFFCTVVCAVVLLDILFGGHLLCIASFGFFFILPAVAYGLRFCIADFYIDSSRSFAKYSSMLDAGPNPNDNLSSFSTGKEQEVQQEGSHGQSHVLLKVDSLKLPKVEFASRSQDLCSPPTTTSVFLSRSYVLLTGATGFLGSVLLRDIMLHRERLSINGVVVLCRSKRKKAASTRIAELLDDPMFSFLSSKEKEDIVFIEGDVTLPDLGMASDNMNRVCNEMNISHVFHCAASVSFTQTLEEAAVSNISSSLNLQSLTKRLKRKDAKFVYISTAFVHGANTGTSSKPLPEELHSIHPYDPSELYRSMLETQSCAHTALHDLGFPNTYTFSKCVCEHLLVREREVDTVIIRPSIIGPAVQEPYEGWAGEKPSTIVAAACLYMSYQWNLWSFGKQRVPFVPVDVVSRFVLSKAFLDNQSGERHKGTFIPDSSPTPSDDDEFERISNWSESSSFGSGMKSPASTPKHRAQEHIGIYNSAWDSSSPDAASFTWVDYAVAVTQLGSVRGYFHRAAAYLGLFFTVKLAPQMDLSVEVFERIHYVFVRLPITMILGFLRYVRWSPVSIRRLSRLSSFLDLPLLFFPFMNNNFAFQSDMVLPDDFNGERYMFSCVAAAERFVEKISSMDAQSKVDGSPSLNRKTEKQKTAKKSLVVVGGRRHARPTSDLWWAFTQPRGNCVIRVAGWFLIKILRAIAAEVTVDVTSFSESVRTFCEMKTMSSTKSGGLHVILAPTHRSVFDFLVVSYVLFSLPELGLVLPHIAAADEFSRLPVLGLLARLAKAFFLKRGNGSADPSLNAKVKSLKNAGINGSMSCIEVFVEGRRSRDRRFVSPKTGFLRCLEETGGNHLIVPIAINYERIPEQGSLTSEAQGGIRVILSNLGLFSWLKRILFNEVNVGRIHVASSPPIQMGSSAKPCVFEVAKEIQIRQQHSVYVSTYHAHAASVVLGLELETVQTALVSLGSNFWPRLGSHTSSDDGALKPGHQATSAELWTTMLQFGHLLAPLFLDSHPKWCRWLNPVESVSQREAQDIPELCAVMNALAGQFDAADSAVDSALHLLSSKGFTDPTIDHVLKFAEYQKAKVNSFLLRSAVCMRIEERKQSRSSPSEADATPVRDTPYCPQQTGLNSDAVESLGTWGFNDSRFILNVSRDGSRTVMMKGNRYDICGKRLSRLIPFIEKETTVQISHTKTALPFTVPEPHQNIRCDLSCADLEALEEVGFRVSVDLLVRARNGFGHSQEDVYFLRSGSFSRIRVPDAVVWPSCEDEVKHVVELATTKKWCLIPCGGGTNVSHATRCPAKDIEPRPVISVDMKQMNRVLWINEEDGVAHVESGIVGSDLVRELEKRGFTIGHEPDSIEFSTLGGWIATKASGMKRNKYGNIEDIVKAVRVAGSDGLLWQSTGLDKSAFGRESRGIGLCSLMLGSEGCFGVITSAVVRIWPLAECRQYESVILPDLDHGLRFVRDVAKLGQNMPASVRLLDNEHFRLGQALHEDTSLFERSKAGVVKFIMRITQRFSPESVVCVTIAYEGSKNEVAQQEKTIKHICASHGGFLAGSRTGRAGYDLTFVIAYLRDFALSHYLLCESFETFAPWSRMKEIISATKRRIREEHWKRCLPGEPFVGCRVTQLYHEGACLYFYFCMNFENVINPSSVFADIERCARREILERGGSLSHHHGVGKIRASFLSEMDSTQLQTFRLALKKSIDPKNVFGARNGPFGI